jgi:predicted acyl esterase
MTLARTQWTRLPHKDFQLKSGPDPDSSSALRFEALGDGVTFISEPLGRETEITGPLAARLTISSTTSDADLFLVFRVFTPDLREVTFMGAIDPHTPVAQGWLRASHRKLDPRLSTEYRPYHTHDEVQPLTAGKAVTLDIELWPTSIVVPAGHRVALTVRGKDYEWQASTGARLSNFKNELRGCGPFLHDDPRDRPAALFGGTTTLYLKDSYVLIPVIP